jgi:hypothetical protein
MERTTLAIVVAAILIIAVVGTLVLLQSLPLSPTGV